MPSIHFNIGDKIVCPPEFSHDYTERQVLVPNSYFISGHRFQYLLDQPIQTAASVSAFVCCHASLFIVCGLRRLKRAHVTCCPSREERLAQNQASLCHVRGVIVERCFYLVCMLYCVPMLSVCMNVGWVLYYKQVESPRSERERWRSEHGLPSTDFLMANFNNLDKLEPRIWNMWNRIIDANQVASACTLVSSALNVFLIAIQSHSTCCAKRHGGGCQRLLCL
jgi:hypothetical protein